MQKVFGAALPVKCNGKTVGFVSNPLDQMQGGGVFGEADRIFSIREKKLFFLFG